MSRLLDRIVAQWLGQRASGDEELIREAASACLGSIRGGDPARASQVRERVRTRLARNRAT